jgi:hypothetical protein
LEKAFQFLSVSGPKKRLYPKFEKFGKGKDCFGKFFGETSLLS